MFETVVLTDIVDGRPEGLALDIKQSRPVEGSRPPSSASTTGWTGRATGHRGLRRRGHPTGFPRKPGMLRMDLLEKNAGVVRQMSESVARYAPDAVIVVVANPGRDDRARPDRLGPALQPRDGPGRHVRRRSVHEFRGCELGVPVGSVQTLTLARTVKRWCRCRLGPPSTASPCVRCFGRQGGQARHPQRNGGAEIVALLEPGFAY